MVGIGDTWEGRDAGGEETGIPGGDDLDRPQMRESADDARWKLLQCLGQGGL
jgi:hypothetical protein